MYKIHKSVNLPMLGADAYMFRETVQWLKSVDSGACVSALPRVLGQGPL